MVKARQVILASVLMFMLTGSGFSLNNTTPTIAQSVIEDESVCINATTTTSISIPKLPASNKSRKKFVATTTTIAESIHRVAPIATSTTTSTSVALNLVPSSSSTIPATTTTVSRRSSELEDHEDHEDLDD